MSGSGGEQGSRLLRVQGSSRFAFGATTAALVTLASGGTAALVAHGTAGVSTPTSLPGALLAEAPGAARPVVVDRVPGTSPAPPAVAAPDRTVEALREALVASPSASPRTLVAPLVALTGGPRVTVPALPVPVRAPLPTAAPSAPPPVPAAAPAAGPTAPVVASPATDTDGKGSARRSSSGAAHAKGKGKGKHAR